MTEDRGEKLGGGGETTRREFLVEAFRSILESIQEPNKIPSESLRGITDPAQALRNLVHESTEAATQLDEDRFPPPPEFDLRCNLSKEQIDNILEGLPPDKLNHVLFKIWLRNFAIRLAVGTGLTVFPDLIYEKSLSRTESSERPLRGYEKLLKSLQNRGLDYSLLSGLITEPLLVALLDATSQVIDIEGSEHEKLLRKSGLTLMSMIGELTLLKIISTNRDLTIHTIHLLNSIISLIFPHALNSYIDQAVGPIGLGQEIHSPTPIVDHISASSVLEKFGQIQQPYLTPELEMMEIVHQENLPGECWQFPQEVRTIFLPLQDQFAIRLPVEVYLFGLQVPRVTGRTVIIMPDNGMMQTTSIVNTGDVFKPEDVATPDAPYYKSLVILTEALEDMVFALPVIRKDLVGFPSDLDVPPDQAVAALDYRLIPRHTRQAVNSFVDFHIASGNLVEFSFTSPHCVKEIVIHSDTAYLVVDTPGHKIAERFIVPAEILSHSLEGQRIIDRVLGPGLSAFAFGTFIYALQKALRRRFSELPPEEESPPEE